MKICVAGGAGLTGQCAVRDLLRSKNVESICVADYDQKGLDELRRKLKVESSRIEFKKIDVRNELETTSVFKGNDVVINGVQYYFNLNVMSAALRAKTNYLDFGGLYYTTLEQIRRFDKHFRNAGLLGVVGMGAQPGVSNLMVKQAIKGFSRADSVEILDGWRDKTKSSSPIYFTWSPLTFFDESSKEAVVFENGKIVKKPPFSDSETVDFPAPVGKVEVCTALHSELATIPESFESYGVKKVVWKEGGADFWKIRFLADLGLTSDEKIPYGGVEIAPREFLLDLFKKKGMLKMPSDVIPNDFEVTRVIVKGWSKRGGGTARKTVVIDTRFPAYKPWKVSCSQYNVGIPGSIAAQMIASQAEKLPKGVLPAEKVFEPSRFFKELKKRNILVRQKTQRR
jgi:saccharopine dehydrogenase-like NADP-dependent oxidoreductase